MTDDMALLTRQRSLDAISQWEPWLNAVVAATPPGEPVSDGVLHGLSIGIKDLMDVQGMVRGCAAPGLVPDVAATQDAEAVGRLRRAGGDIVATLTTHQFAYGIVTPQTQNPRAPAFMAGGSSGGPAAAVAAGIVDAALGSDTGGSIRIPAACCGVVGFKPTLGLIPTDGVQPLSPSMDTLGPLARDVETTTQLFGALTNQSVSLGTPARPRIGLVTPRHLPKLDPGVLAAMHGAVETALKFGAIIREISLPMFVGAPRASAVLLGHEALVEHRERLKAHPDKWWPDVRDRLERARTLTSADLATARAFQEDWCQQVSEIFRQVDVVIMPVLAFGVPKVGTTDVQLDGHSTALTPAVTRLTNPWNLAGVPAGAIPIGRDPRGAPIGMQVIGPWDSDLEVLEIMQWLQNALGGPWPLAELPGSVG